MLSFALSLCVKPNKGEKGKKKNKKTEKKGRDRETNRHDEFWRSFLLLRENRKHSNYIKPYGVMLSCSING